MMTIRWLLLTVLCVALLSVGQMLFKAAAGQWRVDGWGWSTWQSLLSLPMLSALAIYGATTILWVFILRQLPLSVAYPLYALSFLFVPLLGHWVIGEPLTVRTLVGGAIIIAGIAVTAA
jgi:drug/metabolite transporter (DMT)-like permease